MKRQIRYLRESMWGVMALVMLVSWLGWAADTGAVSPPTPTTSQSPVVIEVLERADCAHCLAERDYLDQLSQQRRDISVRFIDIDTPEGSQLFDAVVEKADLSKATPVTIVGTSVFQGFDSDAVTGKRIEALIGEHQGKGMIEQGFAHFLASTTTTPVAIEGSSCDTESGGVCKTPAATKAPLYVRIPFTDTIINVSTWTLPALAATIGFLDGFNPCAMWVLVTFLIVLMQLQSRRQMWFVAGSFIIAEGVMYYLILNVWLKTWDFIGMDRVITPMVGVIALGGGLFFLYEWYKSLGTEVACQIIDREDRSRIIQKIKRLATGKFTLISLVSIVALAFSVNVIEFACSIGYPQAFTKILQVNALGFWHTQSLMATYVLFYMVDDLIVFGLALWGFDKLHLTQGFSRWSALIGGLLMLVLGWLLLFQPEMLRSFS